MQHRLVAGINAQLDTRWSIAMLPAPKVAERLLAHARLCRKFASASLDENIGAQLLELADKCMHEAAEAAALERLIAQSK